MQNHLSRRNRSEILSILPSKAFDVVIVGGGISGLGCFHDAAGRGLKVLLLEKGDFSSGTSSRSSKLIHGGLRYLETFDWGLVLESCRERGRLLSNAPDLVTPLDFLVPVYKGDKRPLWMVQVGVWLYHFMALFRDVGHPQRWSKKDLLETIPFLEQENLRGAMRYSDALMNDVELSFANLYSGWDEGGEALNHAEVKELRENKGSWIATFEDRIGGATYEVETKCVLNASGPWASFQAPSLKSRLHLRPTKGVHLILPRERLPIERALLLTSPDDQRVSFAIPWEGRTLLGTTDTDFRDSPDHVSATKEDVQYLLRIAAKYFPDRDLSDQDVLSTFAGVRPLLFSADQDNPSAVSREHVVHVERPGFLSLLGGKYTTFRQMAEEAIDKLLQENAELRMKSGPCITEKKILRQKDFSLTNVDRGTSLQKIEEMIQSDLAATPWDVLGNRSFLAFFSHQETRDLLPEVLKRLPQPLPDWMMEEFETEMRKTQSGLSVDKPE